MIKFQDTQITAAGIPLWNSKFSDRRIGQWRIGDSIFDDNPTQLTGKPWIIDHIFEDGRALISRKNGSETELRIWEPKSHKPGPMEVAFTERRYGRFTLDKSSIYNRPDATIEIFRHIIVIRATQLWDSIGERIEYMGISPDFQSVGPGQVAPTYTFETEQMEDGTITVTAVGEVSNG